MNFAKVEQILKINGDIYNINDIVEVKYSDAFVKNNTMSFPTNIKSVIGRICSLDYLVMQIDDSERYYRSYKNIAIEDIIEINKIKWEG